jgi:hypothetical protein
MWTKEGINNDDSNCPLPHTCQLCLQALSKLEFFSLALRKIALSLKSVFPERSSEEEVIRRMMMTTEEKSIRRR